MKLRLKKIDAIIVVALIVVSVLFLYKAGYISSLIKEEVVTPPEEANETTPPPEIPTPPTSFIPSYRRDVSPEDEGVHYDKIRISREWWYFSAVFNGEDSELKDWTVAISFNHMARGDLIGTQKPDLLVVTLHGNDGETFGGMINKKRYLGILNFGTLIASSPGVNVEFEDSWAEGEYPNWHVHAEDKDIDNIHEIIIDLDYKANSLPLWTIGCRAFDKSKSSIANYLFTGCEITGTVEIDGEEFTVNGTGHHEHSWTPNAVTKGSINGWDWFHMTLDNGWNIYASNFLPTPQFISGKTSKLNPFGTLLITTDNGETVTELKNVDIKITREDNKLFPFVRMPADFSISATPSLNPVYIISQSLLYGTNTVLDVDIEVENSYNKVWKFPTYMGMKVGACEIEGMLSWSDEDGEHQIPINGIGVSWSMRALL
jgi:predicted secreted hydrolase